MKLFVINHGVFPDEQDEEIACDRLVAWNSVEGPRVGDFVEMPNGGMERFSYDWGEQIQTCTNGNFYLDKLASGMGYASMSGGLNPAIDKRLIVQTAEKRPGNFWFFHHNFRCPHNGVGLTAPCRVFRVMEGRKT